MELHALSSFIRPCLHLVILTLSLYSQVPLNLDGDDQTPSGPSGEPRKLHQFPPKEVAEELSLMDAQLLRKIVPEELQNGAWMKKDSKVSGAPL